MGGTGFEPVTSAMSDTRELNPVDYAHWQRDSKPLDAYTFRLRLQGLSNNYIGKLTDFLSKYVEWAGDFISPESAIAYLALYQDRKPNTRARYATYLKGFMTFLGMKFDVRVKVPKLLPPFVSEDDIAKIRNRLLEKRTHRSTILRDVTLLDTAVNTGLRRSELANLKVRHIDFTSERLMVVDGKGGKDRVIPLASSIITSLQELCQEKNRDERVFGLAPRGLGMKISNWAKKAGVDIHTHSLRHYFSTRLVERGANIRAVQELLGHTNLNTTQIYLAVTAKHLEDAISLLD